MRKQTFRSCNLCEATCGVVVETDDDRVISVRGDEDDPFSRGYICPKAHGLKEIQHDPDRLRRPIRRTATGWQEISWNDAYAEIAENLRRISDRHGANAVATYLGNPTAQNYGSLIYYRVLARALGTKVRFSATSVDQLPKTVSSCLLFGKPLSIPVPDVDRTTYFLVLGANPVVSNGSLMTAPGMPRRLRALRARGGKLVVVDPRRSETAQIADRHLPIRPGTDALFLFALIHVFFQEGLVRFGRLEGMVNGIDKLRALAADFPPELVSSRTAIAADDIRRVAREFASASAAACYGRIGTCAQEFGSIASWLVDAVNTLTGNLDREGGAMFPSPAASLSFSSKSRKERGAPFGRWRSRVRGLPEFNGELPVVALAEEIDTPGQGQIKALVTFAGNPVLSTPDGARLDRALDKLEYMVSIDIYRNETTRHANIILPTTWALEHESYPFSFNPLSVRIVAKYSEPAMAPEPDSREDWQILLELSAHLQGNPQASIESLDELVLGDILPRAVGHPHNFAPNISAEQARAKLGNAPGPERLLDLMLRAGAFGDHFEDGGEGLSLRRIKEFRHGLDLGPMVPRLPGILATESRKIELAPELLVADAERLRDSLARDDAGLVLIGRRQLRSNNSWMHNVPSLVKGRPRCTLMINPLDADRLTLANDATARVTSRTGSVMVAVAVTDEIMPGVVSLPHGWGHDVEGVQLDVARRHAGVSSNTLADTELYDGLSGEAAVNGIPVSVEPA